MNSLCGKKKKLPQRKIHKELEAAKTSKYHFVHHTGKHCQDRQHQVTQSGEAGFWKMCALP